MTHTGESALDSRLEGVIELDEVLEAVRRLQAGDQSAFDDLYAAYAPTAIRTAYLITRSQTAAEDATQDAFVQLLRNITALQDAALFRPWFYRIVVNAAKRLARAGSIQTVPLDLKNHDKADLTSPFPDEKALTADDAVRLRAALAELSDAHRVPVFLRYFTGLSEQEVAQALNLPQGTVKSRLHYARKRLLESLDDGDPAPAAAPYFPARKG